MPDYTVLRDNTLIARRTRTRGEVVELDSEHGEKLVTDGFVVAGTGLPRERASEPTEPEQPDEPQPRRTVTRKS